MQLEPGEILVLLRGMEVLVEHDSLGTRLFSEPSALAPAEAAIWVGRERDRAWYAARPRADLELPAGVRWSPVRALFAEFEESTLHMIGRALACLEFEDTHRFCGRCATATVPGGAEEPSTAALQRVRSCPNCGLSFHPRIPPAVIVLVERDHEILLARGANFPPGLFSAVAGFVEIGEALEDAARREVREEVGVEIAELRYFSSQPWPFGHSLMIGFHARYAGGVLQPDGLEITEAGWFSRDRLAQLPPSISIARRMIDAFLSRPA